MQNCKQVLYGHKNYGKCSYVTQVMSNKLLTNLLVESKHVRDIYNNGCVSQMRHLKLCKGTANLLLEFASHISILMVTHLNSYCNCYVNKMIVSFPLHYSLFDKLFQFRPYISEMYIAEPITDPKLISDHYECQSGY